MEYGKIWGKTKPLLQGKSVEVHEIFAKKGTQCSMHKHQTKFNAFYVISGKMNIIVEKNDYDLVDTTTLEAGGFTTVSPGEYHRFKAIEDTIALELYYTELDHNDIVRKDVGCSSKTKQILLTEEG